MKLITMRCTNCGAELEIDPDRQQVFCSYCGTKLLLDDESVHVTSRIVDEARLKEAEVRLKELEYAHEKELREETLLREQKKVFRIAAVLYICAVLISYSIPSLRTVFPLVLVVGGVVLLSMSSSDKKNIRQNQSYDYSPKSRAAALLLCIIAGEFGAHYFYVGRIGMGILYLFTFGFLGFGWLIDIIRIACGTFRDNNGNYLK